VVARLPPLFALLVRLASERIHYVGDIDDAGLEIAWSARRCAAQLGLGLGLPTIEPATEVHKQMLVAAHAFGHPDGWAVDERVSRPASRSILDILTQKYGSTPSEY